MIGWNARMDGFQAGVLNVKLKRLTAWNEARRNHAQLYNKLLANLDGVIIPRDANYAKHVYHVYPIRSQKRDELINALTENQIHCGIHYPVPIHLQEAYKFLGYSEGTFPVAERYAKELISLPMYPELTHQQQKQIVDRIKQFVSKG
jgi:dTDP-4-amino-4,6-dideoxygalactose transaminase